MNPNYLKKFLYFRASQGYSGSAINPALQDNVLLPEGFTEYIYHVGNGNELRSIVNHGLIPGGVSLRTDRQAVWIIKMALGNPYEICHKQESRHTKILGNAFRITYLGSFRSTLNKEDCNFFFKQGQTQLSSSTHCLQSSLRKRNMHEDQGSASSKGKRDSKTECCSESYFAKWFTRSTCTRIKIILGTATRCGQLRGKPKQHC